MRWCACMFDGPACLCCPHQHFLNLCASQCRVFNAWPNFSGSEESTSEGPPLCVLECVNMCARALLWVFPPCLSNRKLMWSSTEDKERAFLSTVNHLKERERELKKRGEKKERLGLCIDSVLCNLACFSPLLSFSSPYYLFCLFFCSLFVLHLVVLMQAGQQRSVGDLGFMESSWVLWEDGEEEGGLKKQMKRTSVGSSAVLPVQF